IRSGRRHCGGVDVVPAHIEVGGEDGGPQPPEPAVADDGGGGGQHGAPWYGGAPRNRLTRNNVNERVPSRGGPGMAEATTAHSGSPTCWHSAARPPSALRHRPVR